MKRDNPFVAGNPASTSDLIVTIEEMQKEIEKLKQSRTTHPNLDNLHGIKYLFRNCNLSFILVN